jgi:mono/diheme cytochrome c family protein
MKPLVATILACTALVFALGALSAGAQSTGNVAAGKKIFQANCSACHGATGAEGGVGPSLKNETKRKNYQQIVAWIKNPQPPMPKLYPSPLSATDVNNVAAYVATIK